MKWVADIVFRLFQSHLESVSESFRTLSMSIRDVGSLYRSEAKYYIGLAIAFLEFRLQAMPKTQLVCVFT